MADPSLPRSATALLGGPGLAAYIGAMQAEFRKMHGLGNDFIVIDERTVPLDLSPDQVRRLADRRLGIGCDQFITLHKPPPRTDADLVMRIRNPDGSEAGACGNATRCVAELLFEQTGYPYQVIRTLAGDLAAERLVDGRIRVDMGRPGLDWAAIPLARPMDTLHLDLPGEPAACSMGNPHATFFVADVDTYPVTTEGPALERDPLFPDRANIGFAQVLDRGRIRLRVWERGAGLTLACGSGACATAVNAYRRGLAGRQVRVIMDGGPLDLDYTEGGRVLMTGPAETSFRGQVEL